MNATRAAAIAAVLGGLVWAVAAVLGWGDDVNAAGYAVGLVLYVLALAVLGYTLVETAPVWLRGVVSLATPALGCAILVAVSDGFTTNHIPVLLAGLALLAAGGTALFRGRGRTVEAPVRGRRAAR